MKTVEGLLDKARRLREASSGSPPAVPEEDQSEILEQIEKIVRENRIHASPELFTLHPVRKGHVLPLLINLLALVVVAGGLVTMYLVFAASQRSQAAADVELQSAEGKLLQEIRRQSEAELAAKDKQLKDIEDQLGKVQKEKINLSATMDDKVRKREAALQSEMQAQIEVERQKLRAQGLSEEEVNRRIKDFERRKTAEFNAQLNEYRLAMDQERSRAEQQLSQLETQFSSQLTRLSKDREALMGEFRQKEAELRQKLTEAQAQGNAAADEATRRAQAAASQIERLNEARNQEKALEQQVAGYYAAIASQMEAKNHTQAAAAIERLQAFLRSPGFGASESLVQKRDRELQTTSLLLSAVDAQRLAAQASSMAKNAALIAEAETYKAQAQDFMKSGDLASAERSWGSLIKTIPGAAEALEFRLAQETRRQNEVNEQLKSSFETELTNLRKQYTEAASLSSERDRLSEEIARSREATATVQAERDKTAAELQKLRSDSTSERRRLQGEIAMLGKSLAELQGREQTRTTELATLQGDLDKARADLAKAKAELAATPATAPATAVTGNAATPPELAARLEKLEKDLAAAQKLASTSQANLGTVQKDLSTVRAELAAAQAGDKEYRTMVQLYQSYLSAVKALNPGGNRQDLATSKNLLETFFNSSEMKKAFPGLAKSIQSYEQAIESSGQRSAVVKLNDRLFEIAAMKSKDQQVRAIRSSIQTSRDSSTKEFYETLLGFLGG